MLSSSAAGVKRVCPTHSLMRVLKCSAIPSVCGWRDRMRRWPAMTWDSSARCSADARAAKPTNGPFRGGGSVIGGPVLPGPATDLMTEAFARSAKFGQSHGAYLDVVQRWPHPDHFVADGAAFVRRHAQQRRTPQHPACQTFHGVTGTADHRPVLAPQRHAGHGHPAQGQSVRDAVLAARLPRTTATPGPAHGVCSASLRRGRT